MRSPIILDGKPFDWDFGSKMQDHIADAAADGQVNWGAAMMADPGVMKCPGCGEYLWNEGKQVKCPECGHEWETGQS